MRKELFIWALCFTLISGLAVAGTFIENTKIYGQQGIPGWLKAYDTFTAEAVVGIDGDSVITTNQVKIGFIDSQACTPFEGGFKCTLTFGAETYFPSETSITFHLSDDSGLEVLSQNYVLGIDGYGPSVNLISDSAFTNGENPILMNYTLTDIAFPASDSCSGIGGVTFTIAGENENSIEINSEECMNRGSTLITIPSGEEQVEVCALGYDRLMQNGAFDCQTIQIDAEPPAAAENPIRFELRGLPEGNTFIGPGRAYTADVYVRILEQNLDKVTADFTGVNTQHQDYTMDANGCQSVGEDISECTFNNVEVILGDTNNPAVIINATDLAGNSAEFPMNYLFGLDNTGPEALSITVNGENADPQWVGPKIKSVKVLFTEYGIGLMPEKVFLDISGLGGSKMLPAKECQNIDEEQWSCSWDNISVAEGILTATITVSSNTTDALGNPLVGSIAKPLQVDSQAPTLVSFNMTQPDAPFELPNYIFLEGYSIIVTAKLSENNPLLTATIDPAWIRAVGFLDNESLFGVLDLPDNITAKLIEGCNQGADGLWLCKYTIEKPFPGVYGATFVFEDVGKGFTSKTVEMTVYDVKNATTDYWKIGTLERMPTAVDRSTAPYINHQLLYLVGLTPVSLPATSTTTTTILRPCPPGQKCGGATTTTISLREQAELLRAQGIDVAIPANSVELLKVISGECTGDDMKYVLKATLFDGSDLGERPYYEVLLQQIAMPLRSINFTCEIKLYSLITSGTEKWVNDEPEIKRVNLAVPFFDTELPSEVLQAKIDEAMNNPLVKLQESSIWQFLDQMYGYALTAAKIDRALLLAGDVMTAAEGVCEAFTAGVPCGLGELGKMAMNVHDTVFKPFLSWLSCDHNLWADLLGTDNKFVQNVLEAPQKFANSSIGTKWMKNNSYSESDLTNPKKSLVASIAMLCIPGIMDNVKQFSNIQCGYAYCLQEASKMGVPSTYCDDIKSYGYCVALGEEVTYFFPATKLYEDIANSVNHALKSPISLAVDVTGVICQYTPGVPFMSVVCNVLLLGKALSAVDGVLDMANNWGQPPASVDYCKLIESTQITVAPAGPADLDTTGEGNGQTV